MYPVVKFISLTISAVDLVVQKDAVPLIKSSMNVGAKTALAAVSLGLKTGFESVNVFQCCYAINA